MSSAPKVQQNHRRRLKSLKTRIQARLEGEPEQLELYHKKNWVRRWAIITRWLIRFLYFILFVASLAGAAMFGVILAGSIDVVAWIYGGNTPDILEVRLVGGWTILTLLAVLAVALRMRNFPIAHRYHPWGVNLPISDARLIGAKFNLFFYSFVVGIPSLVAFGVTAYAMQWELSRVVAALMMICLTMIVGWLMSEVAACLMPRTPLVHLATALTVGLGSILVFASCTIREQWLRAELAKPELYENIWRLPPGGWLLALSGVLPFSMEHSIVLPSLLIGLFLVCVRIFWRTLELQDIQIGGDLRVHAYRRLWVRSWVAPRPIGILRRYANDPQRALSKIQDWRAKRMGQDKRIRYWLPLKLSSHDRALLGLLGINYPRDGSLGQLLKGIWPVLAAVSLLITNQYITLVAFPKFMRLPLLLSFCFSLVELREVHASKAGSQAQIGFSAARALFPMSVWQLWRAVFVNRLIFLWQAVPGWLIAIALLLKTDIPRDMVIHPPLIVAAFSLLFTAVVTLTFMTCNLRSSWKNWLLVQIPIAVANLCFTLLAFAGVGGYLMAMRVDAAWACLFAIATTLMPLTIFYGFLLNRNWLDMATVSVTRTIRL